jgi:hypothetical protein
MTYYILAPLLLHLLYLFSLYLVLTLIFLLPTSLSVSSLVFIVFTLLFLSSFAAHHRAVLCGGKPIDLYSEYTRFESQSSPARQITGQYLD